MFLLPIQKELVNTLVHGHDKTLVLCVMTRRAGCPPPTSSHHHDRTRTLVSWDPRHISFITPTLIQGSIKLFPRDHLVSRIFVLVQKDSNAKKEIYCSAEPQRLFTKFTTQKRKRKKENASFFIATILCFPDSYIPFIFGSRFIDS